MFLIFDSIPLERICFSAFAFHHFSRFVFIFAFLRTFCDHFELWFSIILKMCKYWVRTKTVDSSKLLLRILWEGNWCFVTASSCKVTIIIAKPTEERYNLEKGQVHAVFGLFVSSQTVNTTEPLEVSARSDRLIKTSQRTIIALSDLVMPLY